MKITIEKTETVKTEVDVPNYFTTYSGWYYMLMPDNQVLHVTEWGVSVMGAHNALKHTHHCIKPCTQDEFIQAYCQAINVITAASGIEHLPLEIEGGAYAD